MTRKEKKQTVLFFWGVFAICLLLLTALTKGYNEFQKANVLNFTVIGNSGEMLNRVQHKHNSTLETVVWVRIKYDSTNKIDDIEYDSPFAAIDYPVGANLHWIDPPRYKYERAGYDVPWYLSELVIFALVILGFFGAVLALVIAACETPTD